MLNAVLLIPYKGRPRLVKENKRDLVDKFILFEKLSAIIL